LSISDCRQLTLLKLGDADAMPVRPSGMQHRADSGAPRASAHINRLRRAERRQDWPQATAGGSAQRS
jgi:hypothetical protein